MKIYYNNTELVLTVNDNSYRYRAIMGENSLTLYYSLAEHVEIPVGAYCVFEGQTYTLEKPENFKMHNTRNFEYTLIMDSPQAKLSKYKFKDTTTRRLKFTLTAKPREHLQMIIDNLNLRETGWSIGSCIDAVEKPISYNHSYLIDALSQMTDSFETEWEIDGKTINLGKTEYNKENPLPLSYGRGNGFKPGLGRSNTDKSKPVEILYVQGGDRNMDASKYGSTELLLPKNQTLVYEGRTYISDEDGFSIRRADKPLKTYNEDSLDCSHIYPSRVGTITSVIEVDEVKHFYDFIDTSIPENLNYEECLIEGEELTVIFQDGMLAGKEFEVKYIHNDKRFEIVPQEIDGRTMPDNPFQPVTGQKYAVFGMMMPDAYICDNSAKTGASWDMFREAAKYLYENEEQKFTFTGELDGIWAKKDWLNIGGKIKLGAYVMFRDERFQPDGVLIRIVGIKDYINNPHSPVIELSNTTTGTSSIISDLNKIGSNEVVVEDKFNKAIQYSKRSWRDAVETLGIMENALLKNFTESINPVTVRTMALLIGDESLQFRFVDSKTNPHPVEHRILFDNGTKVLNAPAGIIQHMTMGIDAMAPSHASNEYKFWDIPEFNSPPLEDEKRYYLYAKVSGTGQTGVFHLSETAIAMDSQTGYYYLWVGFLNSAYEDQRTDFVNVNRYTEILPGQITTDIIRDSLARLVIDLKNARIIAQNGAEIIGKITFTGGTAGYNNIADKPDIAAAINTATTNLMDYVEGAFADGLISEAESENIRLYLNVLAAEKANIDSGYTVLYASPLLAGTAKTNLYNAKTSLNTAYNNLVNAINSTISDGLVTDSEKNSVDSYYASYRSALQSYSTRYEEAHASMTSATNAKATDALTAAENASNAAKSAQTTANSANTTANAAAKVFYSTSAPTSGMKTNDLWVDGTDIYRYNGSSWVFASKYDVTQTVINGGLITTGAIAFGGSGGMSASGTIRIWSGGSSGANGVPTGTPTFRVLNTGAVYASNSVNVQDQNGSRTVCGFSSDGTNDGGNFENPGSIRIWAGGQTPDSGTFKVTQAGYVFGTQFITNGLQGRMDSEGFQFGNYEGGNPYAFLHTNNNPLLRLRSNMLPLEVIYNGGLSGTAVNIKNAAGDNSVFQLGYFRYGTEWFGRPVIRMTNPIWGSFLSSPTKRNVCWDENTGYVFVE